ncbi:hypothetical protein CEXT_780211 [Caerostris extrusa]|uniref:Uncharacterized protein n=1 Tax=Caerostris extrusa TaxID=172846 RepID=A0AAV4S6M1_CAEEX|nr:hypothetical protein CEXT_780211 [Caerostris extrusa]
MAFSNLLQMFIIALLSCIALSHASFVPIVQPYHAPSYEVRHAVRDHLGERVREEVVNPAVGVVAGSSRIADFREWDDRSTTSLILPV